MDKNRDYYTFAELIAALRKPYQETQTLLNELKEYINVESDEPYTKDLNLILKSKIYDKCKEYDEDFVYYNNPPYTPKLNLNISKKYNSNLERIIKKEIYRPSIDVAARMQFYATFELVWRNNHYEFELENLLKLKRCYNPKVYIPDFLQSDFSKKYAELKNNILYSLPSIMYKEINYFQTLSIESNEISLSITDDYKKLIDISYDAKTDKLKIDSKKRYDTLFVENMLLTKIPSYIFPDEYTEFLNSIDNHIDSVLTWSNGTYTFSDRNRNKKEIVAITEEPQKLILKRVNKPLNKK